MTSRLLFSPAIFLACVATASLAVSPLQAFNSLSYSLSTSGFYNGSGLGPAYTTMGIPGFDSSLGTLQDVSLSGTASYHSSVTVSTLYPQTFNAHFSGHTSFNLWDFGSGYDFQFSSPGVSGDVLVQTTGSGPAYGGATWDDGESLLEDIPVTSGGVAYPNGPFSAYLAIYVSPPTQMEYPFTFSGTFDGRITYTYAPVPEPSTLPLFVCGAVALLGCAWSRLGKAKSPLCRLT